MTTETKTIIDKWIEENRMGPPLHGAVYDPGNEEVTCVGIDGEVDLAELASLVESAERERCAKVAESQFEKWNSGRAFRRNYGAEIATEIRKDRGCEPPQAETK